MTISYMSDVATASGFAFTKLLLRWKGSIYKLLWKDLMVFLAAYYLIHLLYMYALDESGRRVFETIVAYTSRYGNFVPLSFLLGFFVNKVMNRWWTQYQTIPWATGIAVYVSSTLHGYDEVGRAMRRTIMRYVCLSLTMVLRVLSPRVRKRFPKMSDLIAAGLLHENELSIIENLEEMHPGCSKNFLPIVWASSIASRARAENRIYDDFAINNIIQALNSFRGQCGVLMTFQTVSIPLVYTQVVTIAVYTYFMNALVSQQYVVKKSDTNPNDFDIQMIPIFTLLQFVFYMGWLKVAEALMNPFGEDDDDFDVNSMIDKNLQTAYLIVDEMHNEHPELLKDQYWDSIPNELPGRNTQDGGLDESDIVNFDVVQRPGNIFRRNSTFTVPESKASKTKDVEAGSSRRRHSRPSLINPELIPRSSIVSGKFQHNAKALERQSILEKKIQSDDTK